MYRTFAIPTTYGPLNGADTVYPIVGEGEVTDAQFKAKADKFDGCNGQACMQTHIDNTEMNSNALAPKSELAGGINFPETPVEGNAGLAKHWIRK